VNKIYTANNGCHGNFKGGAYASSPKQMEQIDNRATTKQTKINNVFINTHIFFFARLAVITLFCNFDFLGKSVKEM
jgi:hypothetical protein